MQRWQELSITPVYEAREAQQCHAVKTSSNKYKDTIRLRSQKSQVPPKHKHREETELLIFKGTLRPKFNLYVLCYQFILYLNNKNMVSRYTHKRMCIYMLPWQAQRKYMGYLMKYYIQKFLIYKAIQVLESNKGIKGLQAHTKICAVKVKYLILYSTLEKQCCKSNARWIETKISNKGKHKQAWPIKMKGETYKRKYRYKGDNKQKCPAFIWYLIVYSIHNRGKLKQCKRNQVKLNVHSIK